MGEKGREKGGDARRGERARGKMGEKTGVSMRDICAVELKYTRRSAGAYADWVTCSRDVCVKERESERERE